MKRYLVAPLILTLLSSCGGEKAEQEQESARYVKTFTVSDLAGHTQRIFPGKAEASETANLSFQVSGELSEFSIKEGEDVEQGAVLARLDPVDFELNVRKLRALRDNAKVEFERSAILLKKDFTSRSSYDLRVAELEVAESDLGTGQERLKDTVLVAPFSGKIAKTYVENFQHVAAKEVVLTLHQINPIDISVQLPEDVVAYLQKNQVSDHYATFSVIPDRRFKAHYKESSTLADPDTQTYDVVMTLDNPEGYNVLPGMTANIAVSFKMEGDERGLLIPFSSVAVDPNGVHFVYVIDPETQKVSKRDVKITQPQADQVEVLEGLQEGDQIVVAGVNFLRENEKVQPLPLEAQP